MKRWIRRSLAIVLGAGLGWLAAGYGNRAYSDHTTSAPPQEHAAETPEHPGHPAKAPEGHGDAEAQAAQLVPVKTEGRNDVPWLGPVLGIAGGLFVAAIVLGVPALKLRGPEQPDPAADDHGHDDHAAGGQGHEAHGHDAHAKPAHH